ncbi:MAG: hypothetical protein V8T27_11140, partial [Ruminococcus bicirculans (ex Wegman et al. 2014)]
QDRILFLHQKLKIDYFFVDERYEQGLSLDENESFYIGKSIAGLKLNQSAQNLRFNEIDKSEFEKVSEWDITIQDTKDTMEEYDNVER